MNGTLDSLCWFRECVTTLSLTGDGREGKKPSHITFVYNNVRKHLFVYVQTDRHVFKQSK